MGGSLIVLKICFVFKKKMIQEDLIELEKKENLKKKQIQKKSVAVDRASAAHRRLSIGHVDSK